MIDVDIGITAADELAIYVPQIPTGTGIRLAVISGGTGQMVDRRQKGDIWGVWEFQNLVSGFPTRTGRSSLSIDRLTLADSCLNDAKSVT